MFEGNRHCALCEKKLEEGRQRVRMSLSGYSFAFCEHCSQNRLDEVSKLLHR